MASPEPARRGPHWILLGAVVIAMVGMLDDIFDLPPLLKLAGQVVAAVIPVSAGVTVDVFTLPFVGGVDPGATELFRLPLFGHVDLGELGTVVGIVAMANVVNLIDGVDGLLAPSPCSGPRSVALTSTGTVRPSRVTNAFSYGAHVPTVSSASTAAASRAAYSGGVISLHRTRPAATSSGV